MNNNKNYEDLLNENQNCFEWIAIHNYPINGTPSSFLIGDDWSPDKIWKKIAEDIYQPLEINVFKFVLFSEIFEPNDFPVIVKLLPYNSLKLKIEKNTDFTIIEIYLKDFQNDNLASLYSLWKNFNKNKIEFSTEQFCKLLPYLGLDHLHFSQKCIINDIIERISINDITIESVVSINDILKKKLKYIFIGALLWPWKILVYEALRSISNKIRVGFVLSLKEECQPEDIIKSPAFFNIYIKGLNETWEKEQKKVIELENIKYKVNINYTVHSIKTMLGGLMETPLNSLAIKLPFDEDVKMVKESKEIIENLVSILNLITKVEENQSIKEIDLVNSKLFNYKNQSIDMDKLFIKINEHRKKKGDGKHVNLTMNNLDKFTEYIKYKSLFATENFYLLYFLTLIENAFDHGKLDFYSNSIDLSIHFDSSAKKLFASNIADDPEPPPSMDLIKGNIKLFNTLLNFLNIGHISFHKDIITNAEDEDKVFMFKTTLNINGNEK
jgi:hypothetical protein